MQERPKIQPIKEIKKLTPEEKLEIIALLMDDYDETDFHPTKDNNGDEANQADQEKGERP